MPGVPQTRDPVQDVNRSGSDSVKVLDKALVLLDRFVTDRPHTDGPQWGLSELARTAGLPKATTYRILRVLTRHRYLSQDPVTARFAPGSALRNLCRTAGDRIEMRRVALPILRRISRTCGETALVMVLDDSRTRGICIEQVPSRHGLHVIREVGIALPLHAGASSKTLLAWLPPDEITALLAKRLPRVARATIVDPVLLARDLERTRRRGYAYSAEETNDGAAGVAVPVLDDGGRIHASLGIMGPLVRFPRGRLASLVAVARAGAGELAMAVGLATAGVAQPATGRTRARRVTAAEPDAPGNAAYEGRRT
jgi:DNA-binding IclR family transcriptional regulator